MHSSLLNLNRNYRRSNGESRCYHRRKTIADDYRREETVTTLTKDRDALIRSKKDIKHKFDSLDTWLHDYQRVCPTFLFPSIDNSKWCR